MSLVGARASAAGKLPDVVEDASGTDVGTSRPFNDGRVAVYFTAPRHRGKGSSVTYTVTSNPGGITATGNSSPIYVSGLSSEVDYTFTVTASNSGYTSPAVSTSSAVTATTAPQAPTLGSITTASDSTGKLNVYFSAGSAGGKSIASYTVTTTTGESATGSSSPISITGLTPGTTYTVKIVANNSNGSSSESSPSTGKASEYLCSAGGTLSGSTCSSSSSYAGTYNAGYYSCPSGYSPCMGSTACQCGQCGACATNRSWNPGWLGKCATFSYDNRTGYKCNYVDGLGPTPSYVSAYYTCPSGGSVSGSNCVTSTSYSATIG
jgi:hypothetical protein